MRKRTIRDFDWRGKRALVRVDFNVPFERGSRRISDDVRVREALPTIAYVREQGASVVLCSHLGRPDGRRDPDLQLEPVADRLAELIGSPVAYVHDAPAKRRARPPNPSRPAPSSSSKTSAFGRRKSATTPASPPPSASPRRRLRQRRLRNRAPRPRLDRGRRPPPPRDGRPPHGKRDRLPRRRSRRPRPSARRPAWRSESQRQTPSASGGSSATPTPSLSAAAWRDLPQVSGL